MMQQLQHFVSKIRFDENGTLLFRDTPVQESATPEADEVIQATEFVYKYFYTHPSGNIGSAFRAIHPDQNLITHLAEANATRATVQQDWILRNRLPDGAVIAERYGKMRKFIPGQFLAEQGSLPLHTGSVLTVTHMTCSASVQPGFFHMFGQEQTDLAEQSKTLRLYLNICGPDYAPALTNLLTSTLNTHRIPFTCKITTRPSDYSRTDCGVLYLPCRFFRIFQLALADILPALYQNLAPQVPAFTRAIAPGIGFAEDPVSEISFGAARSRLAAEAILASRANDRVNADQFRSGFLTRCSDQGLDPRALHLNPGSTDDDYFPPDTSEIAA